MNSCSSGIKDCHKSMHLTDTLMGAPAKHTIAEQGNFQSRFRCNLTTFLALVLVEGRYLQI
jgi:hypothetical protein